MFKLKHSNLQWETKPFSSETINIYSVNVNQLLGITFEVGCNPQTTDTNLEGVNDVDSILLLYEVVYLTILNHSYVKKV